MKERLKKLKKPVCIIVMVICLFLLMGCTGNAEQGGDLIAYTVQGSILLILIILAGIIGELFG